MSKEKPKLALEDQDIEDIDCFRIGEDGLPRVKMETLSKNGSLSERKQETDNKSICEKLSDILF